MQDIAEEQLKLYQSLFRGRDDIYARYWEKSGRSGYSPAYDFNWEEFNRFRSSGGSLKGFENKRPVPLTPDVLKKHLLGQYAIGIYPILRDNTSYFVAADFDGSSWQRDSLHFIQECETVGLTPCLERSKSGNGGHVWIFLENPFPCYRSRQMILEILRKALKLSEFDREVSFDRLFPNQDYLSKGGIGNLIALPLQGRISGQGNTLFLNPTDFTPFPDQWDFLGTIHRHSHAEMENAHSALFNIPVSPVSYTPTAGSPISLLLENKLVVNRHGLTPQVIHFLREKLNFSNTDYLVKRRLGKSVYKTPKFFKLIEERVDAVYLPRGFTGQLTSFFKDNQIPYRFTDCRPVLKEKRFSNNIRLSPEQETAVERAVQFDNGVIVAPAGSGKTIVGLEIIARKLLPALILVHHKQLLVQWIERIQSFLEIPANEIGQYHSTRKKPGAKITIAMMQTLARMRDLTDLRNCFGTIIVDECHHIPATTFREVISQLNSRYSYGLTATPKRKHNDESLIFMFIGDIIVEMPGPPQLPGDTRCPDQEPTQIIIRETNLEIPFKFTTDNFQLLAKVICFDTGRNKLIVKDIVEQIGLGRKVLLLSERKDHMEVLALYLKGCCETILISGEDSKGGRESKLRQIEDGHYQVILSTGQFFGEGLDFKNIDCLILAFPFSFEGKLIQYIGRLRGSGRERIIIDYDDGKIPFLERQFKQRQRHYRRLNREIRHRPSRASSPLPPVSPE